MVAKKRPATYCAPACRARASRERREEELRAGLAEVELSLAHLRELLATTTGSATERGAR